MSVACCITDGLKLYLFFSCLYVLNITLNLNKNKISVFINRSESLRPFSLLVTWPPIINRGSSVKRSSIFVLMNSSICDSLRFKDLKLVSVMSISSTVIFASVLIGMIIVGATSLMITYHFSFYAINDISIACLLKCL